jgi:hypothetical protein
MAGGGLGIYPNMCWGCCGAQDSYLLANGSDLNCHKCNKSEKIPGICKISDSNGLWELQSQSNPHCSLNYETLFNNKQENDKDNNRVLSESIKIYQQELIIKKIKSLVLKKLHNSHMDTNIINYILYDLIGNSTSIFNVDFLGLKPVV